METYKSLGESYSSPHLGTSVLSYSKSLMNRVHCLADDNDINCYYQDTDSIHMDEDKVQPLAELYEKKYNKPLIGKQLGQFHSDFEFDGMQDIRSVGLITLGKKSYIDRLEGTDQNGNKQYTYHIRLKGISPAAIEKHVRIERKNNPDYNEWQLFKRLYGGEAITFDLKVNNKARFEKNKGQEFRTYSGEFKRKVKF